MIGAVLLGALLAPLIYKIGHDVIAGAIREFRVADTPPFGYLYKVLETSDFQRYFNRAFLLAALICLWPFSKILKLQRSDFAFGENPRRLNDLLTGLLVAALPLLALGACLELANVYSYRESIDWSKALTRATTTAAGVSLMEEFFFRGALFALLLRSLRTTSALWFLSVFFAAVHFLKPPGHLDIAAADITWTTGFWLAGQVFLNFSNPTFLLAEFTTLLAVGLILGIARLRTKSLWLPIGLHAGWVFGIFFFRGLATGSNATKAGEHLPWIGENLKTGLLPLLVVALTALLLFKGLRPKSKSNPVPTPEADH